MRVPIIPSENAAERLSLAVFNILSLKADIVFTLSDRSKPSPYVMIRGGSLVEPVFVDRDQYEKCVRPVIENQSLQVLRTPRSREILRANSRKDYFINLIGGYLEDSFKSCGY